MTKCNGIVVVSAVLATSVAVWSDVKTSYAQTSPLRETEEQMLYDNPFAIAANVAEAEVENMQVTRTVAAVVKNETGEDIFVILQEFNNKKEFLTFHSVEVKKGFTTTISGVLQFPDNTFKVIIPDTYDFSTGTTSVGDKRVDLYSVRKKEMKLPPVASPPPFLPLPLPPPSKSEVVDIWSLDYHIRQCTSHLNRMRNFVGLLHLLKDTFPTLANQFYLIDLGQLDKAFPGLLPPYEYNSYEEQWLNELDNATGLNPDSDYKIGITDLELFIPIFEKRIAQQADICDYLRSRREESNA